MENPIKIDDLGVPLFLETPIYDPGLRFPTPPPTPPQCDDPVHSTHCSNDYMAAALL